MTEPAPNHFEMRRLESLSNTIFGVAMTLLAYDLPKAGDFKSLPGWTNPAGAAVPVNRVTSLPSSDPEQPLSSPDAIRNAVTVSVTRPVAAALADIWVLSVVTVGTPCWMRAYVFGYLCDEAIDRLVRFHSDLFLHVDDTGLAPSWR
jgi:hypothetical protein